MGRCADDADRLHATGLIDCLAEMGGGVLIGRDDAIGEFDRFRRGEAGIVFGRERRTPTRRAWLLPSGASGRAATHETTGARALASTMIVYRRSANTDG